MAETQPTDPHPSDTPTEYTLLTENGNHSAAQPVVPATGQSWLSLPKYLFFPVLIFLLGSSVDYYDGSIFSAGFGSIGALYKQQNHAAWLNIVYAIIFTVAQPLYSIASRSFNWTILLPVAFLLFALGQWIASLTEPPDPKPAPLNTGFVILLPLLSARAVTAAGACAMVYVPNLVFNVAVSSSDRAIWEAIQASFELVAQFFGRRVGGGGFADSQQLRRNWRLQLQLPLPLLCAVGLWLWSIWQRRSSGNGTGIEPDLRVSRRAIAQPGESGAAETPETSTVTASTAAISIVLLSLAIASFCLSLSIFTENYLQRVGKSDHSFKFATIIPFSVGLFSVTGIVCNEQRLKKAAPQAALFPWTLDLVSRKRLGFILLNTVIQSAIASTVLFILPWYSQGSATSNTWLFRSLDIGAFLGTVVAGVALKRWIGTISPLLYPKTALYMGATSFLLAALCMFVNWTWLRLKWLCYVADAVFGFGNTVIGATLLPCVLEELGEQKKEHQAIVYAGLHLAGNLAFLAVTAISNVAMQELAESYMRAASIPEKYIRSCLADFNGCLNDLDPHVKEKVQAAFVSTSTNFAVTVMLASVVLVGTVALLRDYKFESNTVEGDDSSETL